jgi:ribosome-associated protein
MAPHLPPEPSGIEITPKLVIPESEFLFRRSRSSGPGGQHSNVTESRVEVVFDVDASEVLSDYQRRRITLKLGSVVSSVSQDHRSQLRNRELALERLAEKLRAALKEEKPRRKTKPTAASKQRRLEGKQRLSEKKQQRRPPSDY